MQIEITGLHLEVTPALKTHVTEKMQHIYDHFPHFERIHVTLEVQKNQHIAKAQMHVPKADIHAEAQADNMYSAIDALAEKINRQVLSHKAKLQAHHAEEKTALNDNAEKDDE